MKDPNDCVLDAPRRSGKSVCFRPHHMTHIVDTSYDMPEWGVWREDIHRDEGGES